MGSVGFHSLFSRALVLAGSEVAWLRAVSIKADGSWEGLDEVEAPVDAEQMTEGTIILVAQLLGLLSTFIGERLTLVLVREVWPTVPLDDLDFGNGGKYEKAK